jgi:DNA-binding HxlR family transcriptional regulator
MLGRTYEAEVCSAARTLELVGERWSLLILRDALYRGTTHFADFQRDLGMASNILAKRLEGFVAAGLMEQRRYSERPEHHEYLLTDKGRELQAVIIALTAWGDRWAAPAGPPILYEHADCGGAIHTQLRCSTCGDVGTASGVVARRGPGMPNSSTG